MAFFDFVAKWTGLGRVKQAFAATAAAIEESLAKDKIEDIVLKRIKMRFEPMGANLYAQKDPEGVPWTPILDTTLAKRKFNRNKAQALVDSGTLRDSIGILSSTIAPGRSGKAVIGVDQSSKAAKYWALQHYGGVNPKGGIVPARPFLEFAKLDEKAAEEHVLHKIFKKARMFW